MLLVPGTNIVPVFRYMVPAPISNKILSNNTNNMKSLLENLKVYGDIGCTGYKLNCDRDPKAKGGWKCTGSDVLAVKEV